MLTTFLHATLAEYDKCDRPAGKWAGFDQGIGSSEGWAAVFSNNHVYVGGYGSGELSFGSSTETGDYHDHLGTKTGPNAHDTHLDVTIHHDTASVAALSGSSNTNALSSQLGADSFIYKMDGTTGKPSSVYAMDTMPIDGNLHGNGTNGRWGGWSYIKGLDTFDLAGETDVVAVIGMVRGRITLPGTPDKQLTNGKNGCYDPWVAKINVDTNQVVWATKENIEIPAPTDPDKSCDSAYPASVVTTAAGHVITSTDSRISRKYSGQFTKFNGATGAFVWQKDFGQALYGDRGAKMSSAGGEKVIYTGIFKGKDSDAFAPLTSTSCEDGESTSAAIASFDVSATDAPVADWVVTMCGEAAATFVQGDYVYAVGELEDDESTTLAHAPSSTAAKCTMTGALGGYLVKLQKSDGKCVWAKDVPAFIRVTANANSVWAMTSDDDPMKFDATHTVTPSGRDLIMGKFSASDGTGHWGASMGGASTDRMYDMTMTPHGPLALGYSSSESTTVGDVTVNNLQKDVENGQSALFVIQLSSTDKKPACVDECPTGDLTAADTTYAADTCYVDAVCLANGAFSPVRPCFQCDSGTTQKELKGPIFDNHCYFAHDGKGEPKCHAKGTSAPSYKSYNSYSVCETCNPDVKKDGWSLTPGFFYDKHFQQQDDVRRGSFSPAGGAVAGASKYGILFMQNTNGCQLMPELPKPTSPNTNLNAALARPTAGDIVAIGTRINAAVAAMDGATAANQGAEVVSAWYRADPENCAKAADKCPGVTVDSNCVHDDVCDHTPASHADAMAAKFETNLHYGHSIARIKVMQALAIMHHDLKEGTKTAPIAELKKDALSHMLVPIYQGAIEAAHHMDTAATAGTGLDNGAAYWNIIRDKVSFEAGDKARLDAIFSAESASGTNNFCEVKAMLHRNLPQGSMMQYALSGWEPCPGKKPYRTDPTCPGAAAITHASDVTGAHHYTAKAVEDEAVHLTAEADLGTLKEAMVDGNPKTCTYPTPLPPPPPPPSPLTPPVDASSALSEGEIAGIAVGAAVGGIVVLVAVGLILRSLLVRDAKPVFTCLEKAPADKKGPPV